MVTLQYWSEEKWIDCGQFINAKIAWMSLGNDTYNYRVIDGSGSVLKEDKEWF